MNLRDWTAKQEQVFKQAQVIELTKLETDWLKSYQQKFGDKFSTEDLLAVKAYNRIWLGDFAWILIAHYGKDFAETILADCVVDTTAKSKATQYTGHLTTKSWATTKSDCHTHQLGLSKIYEEKSI